MPDHERGAADKVIVVPRPLEEYFHARLQQRFAGRHDVELVIDRRVGERRRERWVSGPGPFAERRGGDRRASEVVWSLPDMPFPAS